VIPIPACTVITAPVDGRVRRLLSSDTRVRAGDVVAELDGIGGRRQLVAPRAGTVGGALADPSQTVTAGEGVLWLSRR
jgi:acetyl/propionyl-CoA carboxylase alpha subunit